MMSLPPGIAPEVARGLLGCQTTVLLRASSARCSSVQSDRGKVLRRPADTTIAGLGCQMGTDIGFAMRARKRIGSITKRLLSSTASKAYGSDSCHGIDGELCTSASPLGGQCTSLLLVSDTDRCSGQGCTAPFLLRFHQHERARLIDGHPGGLLAYGDRLDQFGRAGLQINHKQ